MSSLLPDSHSEFRSKAYWDDFFLKRQNEAFEWYGDYSEIAQLLQQSVAKTDRVLIIGCGNSNFSLDFYDRGYTRLVNLDFSERVIEEMRAKSGAREMVWTVGDMTDLPYEAASFDVVFDKGALDALMSADTPEAGEKAEKMFGEIDRVLGAGGRYVCITLAEQFIVERLLSHYCPGVSGGGAGAGAGGVGGLGNCGSFSVTVDAVPAKKDSPFVPFYVNMKKTLSPALVEIFIDQFGAPLESGSVVQGMQAGRAVEHLCAIQEFRQKYYKIGRFEPNRFEKMQFWAPEHAEIPRFTIFVLDFAPQATLSVAVFMVPLGRESDFQFCTAGGLRDVAEQANCRRLLAVCCNRPHIFAGMAELQGELSPIAMSLKLKDMGTDERIPFMAVGGESEWDVIGTGSSPESGDYVVEEGEDEEEGVLRRLIFLQNQNFIQTEVRMRKKAKKGTKGKSAEKGKKGKKKGKSTGAGAGGAEVAEGMYDFDYSYLDAHHCAAMSALAMLPFVISNAHSVTPRPAAGAGASASAGAGAGPVTALLVGLGGGALPMCLQRYLPNLHLFVCDLDSSMDTVAREFFGFQCNARTVSFIYEGVAVIDAVFDAHVKRVGTGAGTGTVAAAARAAREEMDVVGGGGEGEGGSEAARCTQATPSIPQKLLHSQSQPPSQAQPPDAFVFSSGLRLQGTLNVIFIDADCKDSTLGISAPPPAFLTIETLLKVRTILSPGGAIYFNVVARSKPLLDSLVCKLKVVFAVGKGGKGGKGGWGEGNADRAEWAEQLGAAESSLNLRNIGNSGTTGTTGSACLPSRLFHVQASSETVNEGLLVIKGGPATNTSNSNSTSGSRDDPTSPLERQRVLEQWLQSVGMGADPLKLAEMLTKFTEI
ncbi:hypothetical protein B484DRAFT_445320 [Ochromonadaceae sp. CCMP2298]|nr:hypothetical protein B484DRAFT_445320 [Ochromonadaceae sp. CCMP2298]